MKEFINAVWIISFLILFVLRCFCAITIYPIIILAIIGIIIMILQK